MPNLENSILFTHLLETLTVIYRLGGAKFTMNAFHLGSAPRLEDETLTLIPILDEGSAP